MKLAAVILVLLLLAAPVAVKAQLNYTTNADGVTLTVAGYSEAPFVGTLNIPSNILGLTVVNIANGAFAGAVSAGSNSPGIGVVMEPYPTSVTIPATVTNIGSAAFFSCYALTNVTIPDSVLTIGDSAFMNTGLTSITIPSNVVSVGDDQFSGCIYLTNVAIGSESINIGDGMFAGCWRLTNVTIPLGATSIGTSAFNGCGLTNVVIPGGVTNIGGFAFYGCSMLITVKIPNGVAGIGEAAFAFCANLSSLVIPASMSTIGGTAFNDCNSLTRVLFLGNAPSVVAPDEPLGLNPTNVTVYYTPGTIGWDAFASEQGVPVVLWNPQIEVSDGNIGITDGAFGFDISGTASIPVAVEASDDLTKSNWIPVQSTTLTNGLAHLSDPRSTNYAARYYRIGFP